jgi:soluble lytic murein transglycosylase-like protein
MRLITQPEEGIAPLLAVKRAKRTLDIVIFRFDLKELEDAIAAAVKRGVAVRVLIANTNKGGEQRLRKLEQRMLKRGVAVCRTDEDMVRYHGKLMIADGMVGVPAPHAYDALIGEASIRYGVDAALIRSVMQAESAFDALAVSRAGAMGLMQLMPEVAVEFGVDDPFDPRQNVMAGAKYLRRLLNQYGGDLPLVLASYNAGAGVVGQYGGVPPFPETQNYVKRVTNLVATARRARTE